MCVEPARSLLRSIEQVISLLGLCLRKPNMAALKLSVQSSTLVPQSLHSHHSFPFSPSWYVCVLLATLNLGAYITTNLGTDTDVVNALQPQRCMVYVKRTFPRDQYELAFLDLWIYSFVKHVDISIPHNMAQALREHFSEDEANEIMAAANTPEYKQALTNNTKKALDRGAFGAPWLWVTNDKGESEPFFGSDR